jgi:hypothetical protein
MNVPAIWNIRRYVNHATNKPNTQTSRNLFLNHPFPFSFILVLAIRCSIVVMLKLYESRSNTSRFTSMNCVGVAHPCPPRSEGKSSTHKKNRHGKNRHLPPSGNRHPATSFDASVSNFGGMPVILLLIPFMMTLFLPWRRLLSSLAMLARCFEQLASNKNDHHYHMYYLCKRRHTPSRTCFPAC